MRLTEWESQGRCLKIFGLRVFVLEAGPEKAEPLLVLHGFPTSSADFWRVLPTLSARFRVLLHDHPGFGLSDKPVRYSYSLIEQAEVALEVWKRLGVTRGHLLAHDYGTSVATEILARRERGGLPLDLRSVTLCNGSVHIELARLRVSQRILRSRLGPIFARAAGPRTFKVQMRRLWGDVQRVSDEDLDLMWEGIRRQEGHLRLPAISSYLGERVRYWDRWVGALTRLNLPSHVLWGRKDPVAVPAIADRLAAEIPGARLTWLEGVGHYPMLEAPEEWCRGALGFLSRD